MKQTPSAPVEESISERDVSRVALSMLVLAFIGAAIAFFLLSSTAGWAGAITDPTYFPWVLYLVCPLLALWLNRRAQRIAALWLLHVGLWLVMFVLVWQKAGYGVLLGITAMLLTSLTVLLTRMPGRYASRLIVASVVASLGLVLFDFYGPLNRAEVNLSFSDLFAAILALLTVVLALLFVRRWREMRLSTKLLISFVVVAIASVGAVSYIINLTIQTNLTRQVGASLKSVAVNKADLIGSILTREEDLLTTLSSSQVVQDTVQTANRSYSAAGGASAIQEQINRLNLQWMTASDNDLLIREVLDNASSVELRRFQTNFTENSEVLVTDQYGVVVSATGRTERYYYGDQEWFTRAFNSGTGGLYISQPQTLPRSGQFGVTYAVPVYSGTSRNATGVIRATFNIQALTDALNSAKLGKTGGADLFVPPSQILRNEGNLKLVDPAELSQLLGFQSDYAQMAYEGQNSLVSKAPISPPSQGKSSPIGDLNWMLVVDQSSSEALASVAWTTQAAVLTGLGVMLLAALVAIGGARLLAGPLLRLTSIAEKVAQGDLRVQAPIESSDEIGVLAATFNRMTAQLRQTLETLEQRVADRTTELAHATEQLRERANDLETSSEIARVAVSVLNLEELLPLVTRLIGERFGFSRVSLYLLDPVLHASYNSAETQSLIDQGHYIESNTSRFVEAVMDTGTPRVSQNVPQDSLLAGSAVLPSTRSEMALPLKVADRVIGVLDLHSTELDAFAEADIAALSNLAAQVAVAVQNAHSFKVQIALTEENRRSLERQTALAEENRVSAERQAALAEENRVSAERQAALAEENRVSAERQAALAEENRRLLERSQKAVEDLDALTRRLTGESWDQFLTAQPAEFLVADGTVESQNQEQRLPVLDQAAESRKLVVSRNGHSTVAVPLLLRGEVIGSLALEDADAGREWKQEDLTIIQEVSEHLALALDNARLYSESQQELAERTRAEQALTEERNLLTMLMDNVPDTIYFKDVQSRFIRVNKTFSKRYAGDQPEALIGKNDFDLFTDEHARPAFEDEQRIIHTGQPMVNKEEKETFVDGRVTWALTTKLPLRNALGEIIGTAGITHDITERKLFEAELERRLRETMLLNRVIAAAAMERNPAAVLKTACDEMAAYFGVPVVLAGVTDEKITELSVLADHVPEGRPSSVGAVLPVKNLPLADHVLATLAPVIVTDAETDPRVATLRQFLASRQSRSFLLAPLLVRERIIGIISVGDVKPHEFSAGDVTLVQNVAATAAQALENARLFAAVQQELVERQRAEEAVRASEVFYHTLVDMLPENLCIKDREGRFTFVNQRYCQDMGRPMAEIIGKTDFDLHPYELAEKYRADDLQVMSTGDIIDAVEVHQPLGGDKTYVHTVKAPSRDYTGAITGSQIIFWDVTEQMRAQETLRQQNEYYGALHDMSLGLIARHDVSELLADIVAHAGMLVGTEHGYVYLIDPDGEEMEMRVGVGVYHDLIGARFKSGQGLAGTVWKTGEPVTVDDYRKWPGRVPHPSRDRLRAVAGVPLKSGDRIIGVIGLAYLEEGREFGNTEIDMLTRFAQLAAIALDNAELFQTSQRRLEEMSALNRLSSALSAQRDLNTLVNTVGEHVRQIFNAPSVLLALLDGTRNRIEFPYFLNEGKLEPTDAVAIGEGITSRIIQSGQPLLLGKEEELQAVGANRIVVGEPAKSYLGVPIQLGGETIGVLALQNARRAGAFTENDLRLLTTIAAGVAVAIQNARLFQVTQARAQREYLTREIVARVSRSIDQTTILQTTARQLGQALGTTHVVIRLNSQSGEPNGQNGNHGENHDGDGVDKR